MDPGNSEGLTYFDGKRSFKDVPVDNGKIATTEFLEACEAVAKLFDLLGVSVFSVVQSDMTGNIKKIRDRQLSHPAQSGTLQELVKNELAEKKKVASGGLLWLNRGLSFTAVALRKNTQNADEKLSTSFSSAYSETLKKHHNMIVRGVFSLALGSCPYRGEFYGKLGNDNVIVEKKLEEWLTSLELCVNILNDWIEKEKELTG